MNNQRAKEQESFIEWCKQERINFSQDMDKQLGFYDMSPANKVVIENFVICFDQLLDRQKEYSYTEQNLIKAAQLGQDFSSGNASTIKYDTIEDMIKDNFDLFDNPTYTQEQMIAFGEVVKHACADKAKILYHNGHSKSDLQLTYFQSGADNIQPDKQAILSIDISKILKTT